ncbi:phospholipase A1-Ibeta2, chloroplastic-like [Prosopis cineraria]|uniref:phospholipase A1-Ibeta2, chloroplastic-like n=1 Tax=Prosopis cineraria TaxID=364024 RepID=UPI0024101EDF|nr:phospholipase A1-Ibeta2, chloroplastic-like [Prosopis cineraria]XP_054809945.1 phospholipase A1-Ibeta2, chloroplastic-like [Prosopis cineraria]
MLQISSAIPVHNPHMFQLRRSSFRCQSSPLNPSTKPSPPASTESTTRLHLANLDKLLQKQPAPPITQFQQQQHQQQQPQPIQKETNDDKTKSKNIVEGLSLARLWPEMKATEEMSPRHLNQLQRLLSKTAEYSPRNVLGSRWMEYHGSNDWKGLLDPLDENLRREVVRYGEFVQAAYHSFHSDPAMSPEEPPMPRRVLPADRSYKVTKSLYATSSIGLPKWVDDVAPDLGWMTQRSSWIGYVAVCDDRGEIARMGRRDIVISLRGTATCLEWAENMRAQLTDIPPKRDDDASASAQEKPKVECGFLSLYKTRGAHVPSLATSVIEEVKRLMEVYKGETLSITVTGHSLGAALALLVADEISTCDADVPPVAVISFGGPRVGNKAFKNRLVAQKVKVLRVVNSQDVITRVPGMFVSEEVEQKLRNSKVGEMVEDMGLAYTHVGVELRVDTKMSPYLKPNADMACCHDLEAYLHLVDGFLASNCPFRANAKRSLARLMQDQTSNMKKLYTSKAQALSVNLARQGSFSMPSCLPSPS